jgi:GDSL-like Lipase/Acylhydrolase family
MPHLVLLGDSIIDNGAYTSGGPDVVSQVRKLLPCEWNASLLAVDGATTDDIAKQLECLPADATHLVLSVGGNDALMQEFVLHLPASSTAGAIGLLADVASQFEKSYRSCVETCLRPGLPLTVCTIYNGCMPDPRYQRLISTALTVFNDAILRVAIEHGLPVIDLRAIFVDPEDYANPIEPSSVGGAKMARVIAALVTGSTLHSQAARIVIG